MERNVVTDARVLCEEVEGLCRLVLRQLDTEQVNGDRLYGASPLAAQLKRRSMDLTRALARLRGRGRF